MQHDSTSLIRAQEEAGHSFETLGGAEHYVDVLAPTKRDPVVVRISTFLSREALSVEHPWATLYPHIHGGYRNPTAHSTIAECLGSLFTWHTETVNIHTHLWPAAFSLAMLAWLVSQPPFAGASPEARAATYMCCLGSLVMMGVSAWAHTFHAVSDDWRAACWLLDECGILFLMYGRQFSDGWLLLGVHDKPAFYGLQAASASLALACLYGTWRGRVQFLHAYGVYALIVMCAALVVVAFGPPSTALAASGADVHALRSAAAWNVLCSGAGVLSTAVYLLKVPERWCPRLAPLGSFDTIGNSHHFLHVLSALSAYAGMAATRYLPVYEASVGGAAGGGA